MKTEITKIKLQLTDREIELTAEEAREILAELGKLFKMAAPEKVREIHHHHHNPTPIYIERHVPTWPHKWDIICSTGNKTAKPDMLCMSMGQVS